MSCFQINQMNCFLKEGVSAQQYAEDTLNPIANNTHMRTGAYHYLLVCYSFVT